MNEKKKKEEEEEKKFGKIGRKKKKSPFLFNGALFCFSYLLGARKSPSNMVYFFSNFV
jgi:hypothetical protein